MILPGKHTPPEHSLLALGGLLLGHLGTPQSPSRLWELVREHPAVRSYDAYTLALAFLFSLGALHEHDGALIRSQS